LTSPKKVTIVDDSAVEAEDRYRNWFFKEEYIHKSKSQVYLGDLRSLNPFTEVIKESASILEDIQLIKKTDVVILCGEYNLKFISAVNKRCHNNRTGFILANSLGFTGHVFVDYDILKVYDKYYSGFNNNFYIRHITNEKQGKVSVSAMHPHFFQDGDFVTIAEVEGMPEVNGPDARPIKVIDPFNFTIENTTKYGKYKRGGVVSYVKVPTRVVFNSFEENLENPVFANVSSPNAEFSQMELHVATLLYYELVERRKTDPQLRESSKLEGKLDMLILDLTESNEVLAKIFNTKNIENFKVVNALRHMLRNEKINMLPVAKLVAGVAAFEVIVKSGKFFPIRQNIYLNFVNEFPPELATAFQQDIKNPLSNYYSQFNSKNKNIRDSVNLKMGFIGAGPKAIETIKLMAMMGYGSGPNGSITIISDSKVSLSDFLSHGIYK